VNVTKTTLGVVVTGSEETQQFANDDEDISEAVHCIGGLSPTATILEVARIQDSQCY